jgi:hypothetical protein
MVIKPIRLSWEQHRKLKAEAANFFDKINDRYFYRENVGGLLILIKFFKPNKQSLKIKIGTGFDYLINISSEKKQDEIGTIGLYEDEYSSGAIKAKSLWKYTT